MAYSYRSFGFGGALTPMVKRLLIANVAVFFATLLIGPDFVFEWFAFHPTRVFLVPWGVVTYMFLHGGLMHLVVNMLVLFFFGPPLESLWGSKQFLKYYAICGLGGVALSYVFLPVSVIGASAAMYGLMLAFAMNWPDAPIYVYAIFPVKAKWLVAFLFVLSLLNAFQGGTGGGVAHFAHLGGFLAGLIYLKNDWRPGRSRAKRSGSSVRARRLAIVPGGEEDRSDAGHAEAARRRQEEKALFDRVDQVLDKISAHGMSSLTPDELRLLDEVSRRHRTN
ncbi:MAG TPA: rhomboid family intramembrane serine protease [Longimicrobiales bacterium]|nr:rhomboid family intramembrane serine protease [Longimicrobiales bacterium]